MATLPVEFFAFPLNIILAAIWVLVVNLLYKKLPESFVVRFMLSPYATISSLVLFTLACVVVGLTGNRDMVQSGIFALIVFFLLTVLLFVILRGWRRHGSCVRWRFIFLHVGLLLTLGAGFWGAPDSKTLRLQVYEGVPVQEAFLMNGKSIRLPYEISLKAIEIDTWDNGVSSYAAADLIIDGKEVNVSVNHPYTRKSVEDIYITAYGGTMDGEVPYCILQIVREPWKYVVATGIFMILAGAFLLFLNGPQRPASEEI